MKKSFKPYIIFLLLVFYTNFSLAFTETETSIIAPLQMKFFSKEISFSTHQYKIEINNAQSALLHSITIGLPCGKISAMKNSENWPVKYDVLDQQSGIYGFKLVKNKSSKQFKSIVISFEITALGDYCQNI
ncbi:MAG: hypothetical protein ACOCUV_02655, partial [bacterium]